MMKALLQRIKLVIRYLKYRFKARDQFAIHSPMIYHFYTKVIGDKNFFTEYETAESARHRLLCDRRVIEVTDLGTGGRELSGKYRSVQGIVKKFACSKKEGRLLFRIVRWFKPETMIELGTSAGIGSLYLKCGNPEGKLITVEGCPNTLAVAVENFEKAGVDIVTVCGNIDEKIDDAILQCDGKINFVYFDGNHTKDATISYFEKCRDAATEDAVFVLGDIHWSRDMEAAWQTIQKDRTVRVTIDLFYLGIVFFDSRLSKQDFVLRY